MAPTISHKIINTDVTIQSIALFINFWVGLASLINWFGRNHDIDFFISFLVVQYLTGIWQFLTAWVHYFRPNISPTIKHRRGIHLGISTVLLLIIFTEMNTGIIGRTFYYFWAFILFTVIIPQILAHYYLLITYQDYKIQDQQLKNEIENVVF